MKYSSEHIAGYTGVLDWKIVVSILYLIDYESKVTLMLYHEAIGTHPWVHPWPTTPVPY